MIQRWSTLIKLYAPPDKTERGIRIFSGYPSRTIQNLPSLAPDHASIVVAITMAIAMAIAVVAGYASITADSGVPVAPTDAGSVARLAGVSAVMPAVAVGASAADSGVVEGSVAPVGILVAILTLGGPAVLAVVGRSPVGVTAHTVGGAIVVIPCPGPAGVLMAAFALGGPAVRPVAGGGFAVMAGQTRTSDHIVILGMADPGVGPEVVRIMAAVAVCPRSGGLMVEQVGSIVVTQVAIGAYLVFRCLPEWGSANFSHHRLIHLGPVGGYMAIGAHKT